jgi:hypothetical protein
LASIFLNGRGGPQLAFEAQGSQFARKRFQMRKQTWSFGLIVLLATSQSNAAFVSLNASYHDDGADVSHALPGANLSVDWGYEGDLAFTTTGVTVSNGYFASPDTAAPFGGTQFTSLWALPMRMFGGGLRYDSSILRVDFETPTNYVELWGAGSGYSFMLEAFNTTGDRIGGCATHDHPMIYSYEVGRYDDCWSLYGTDSSAQPRAALYSTSVLRPTADIAYVLAATNFGAGVRIDQITYNRISVPEPATLGLLGFGVLSVAIGRRRRKR